MFQTLQKQLKTHPSPVFKVVKNRRGVALPNLKDYYVSAQLRILLNWCEFAARWKIIETFLFKGILIQATIGDKSLLQKLKGEGNPWISLSVKIWQNVISQRNLGDGITVLRWCAFDSEFVPNKLDCTYKRWAYQGLWAYCTFFHQGKVKNFQDLKQCHGIGNAEFYKFLEVRHYLNEHLDKEKVRWLDDGSTGDRRERDMMY